MNKAGRPPTGIMPRHLHIEKRIQEIQLAFKRYMDQKQPIPYEWLEEYNELTIKYKQVKNGVLYEFRRINC